MGIFGIIWVFINRVNTYYSRQYRFKFALKSESKREHFFDLLKYRDLGQMNYKPGSVI